MSLEEQRTDVYKYFKPKSVTWWAGVGLIALGVAEALAIHVWPHPDFLRLADELTGGLEPAPLIGIGLAWIGLRGAVK